MIAKVCGHCRHWKHDRLCCRFPPVLVPSNSPMPAFAFPETAAGQTCGEWSGSPDAGCSTITTYGPGGLMTTTTTDSAGGTFIERRVK
jgi:hypothetical protein